MTLEQIYREFTPGSKDFVSAVQEHCGFGASDEQIERIATKSMSAAEFLWIWENETWWEF
jgi:hypothetical protein